MEFRIELLHEKIIVGKSARTKLPDSRAMKMHLTLSFCACLAMASCVAQPTSQRGGQPPLTAPGDTVSSIDRNVRVIFQDKTDNYWFGSDGQGVFRYDGHTIIRFSTKDGLLHDRIRSIQEDTLGDIFIATLGGINKFDGQRFTALPVIESTDWTLNPSDLWFAIPGKTGESGTYRYDGKMLHHLNFPKHYLEDAHYAAKGRYPWSPYEVYTIYKDTRGHIWFGTASLGACRFDGTSLGWLNEDHLNGVPGGGSFGIRTILEDKNGAFWVCNTAFRYKISPDAPAKQDTPLIRYSREGGIDGLKDADGQNPLYFLSAVKGTDEALWLATYDQGVWRYDDRDYTHYPVSSTGGKVTVNSIYKDRHGVLWLGTNETGIYTFNGRSFEPLLLPTPHK